MSDPRDWITNVGAGVSLATALLGVSAGVSPDPDIAETAIEAQLDLMTEGYELTGSQGSDSEGESDTSA